MAKKKGRLHGWVINGIAVIVLIIVFIVGLFVLDIIWSVLSLPFTFQPPSTRTASTST